MKHVKRFPTTCRFPRTAARRQRGMSMVEFAIVSPFAFFFVLAIIQLGFLFSAKQIVNEAAFVAARAGAMQNAQVGPMNDAMKKALIPFYVNSLDNNTDSARVLSAYAFINLNPTKVNFTVEVENPSSKAFDDFGLTDSQGHTYIPNDSLNYRTYSTLGTTSRLSIQDANVLRIHVTYGYELKVPLMKSFFNLINCGNLFLKDSGIQAYGQGSTAINSDCVQYYSQGRIPISTYATVQMQTPAWKS